jgi:hypothetical protein
LVEVAHRDRIEVSASGHPTNRMRLLDQYWVSKTDQFGGHGFGKWHNRCCKLPRAWRSSKCSPLATASCTLLPPENLHPRPRQSLAPASPLWAGERQASFLPGRAADGCSGSAGGMCCGIALSACGFFLAGPASVARPRPMRARSLAGRPRKRFASPAQRRHELPAAANGERDCAGQRRMLRLANLRDRHADRAVHRRARQ